MKPNTKNDDKHPVHAGFDQNTLRPVDQLVEESFGIAGRGTDVCYAEGEQYSCQAKPRSISRLTSRSFGDKGLKLT